MSVLRIFILLTVLFSSSFAEEPTTRFYEAQKKLDPGGSFYLYMDTRDFFQTILDELKTGIKDPEVAAEVAPFLEIANKIVDSLGLLGLQDIGMSSFKEGELMRSKSFIGLTDPNKGIWKVFGGEPTALESIHYAPPDTGMYVNYDLDLAALLDLVRSTLREVFGGDEMVVQLNAAIADFSKEVGMDIERLVNSLGGEFTTIARIEPTKKVSINLDKPIEIPQFDLAVMIRVKDKAMYETLTSLIAKMEMPIDKGMQDGVEYQSISFGQSGEQRVFSPTLATTGQYVVFTVFKDFLMEMLKAKKEGLNLLQNADYQSLTKGFPDKVNSFIYAHQDFYSNIGQALSDILVMVGGEEGEELAETFKNQFGKIGVIAGYKVNLPEGIHSVSYVKMNESAGKNQVANMLASTITNMPLKEILGLKEKMEKEAEENDVNNSLRTMRVALEAYYVDFNQYPESADLETLFSEGPGGKANRSALEKLTTPTAYITQVLPDPYQPEENTPFYYYAPKSEEEQESLGFKYMLWSVGPDGVADINSAEIIQNENLQNYIYDPNDEEDNTGDIVETDQGPILPSEQ